MRPIVHFTAPSGWINDPLGLTFHGDRYHLFYQHIPGSTSWAPQCEWGHATSEDLLTWEVGPAALTPGDGDGGCWSGSLAVRDDGHTEMYYTSVDAAAFDIGAARIARPSTGSETSWQKWEKGPVVATLPDDEDAVVFRDPFVFHDGTRWRMMIGGGRADGTATAYGFVADDRHGWTYDGLIASRQKESRDGLWTGAAWECPQLIRIANKWVFLVAVWEPTRPYYTAYAIGDLVEGRFIQETAWQRLTYGPSYYAGSVFRDKTKQPGIVHWIREITDPDGKWVGAHSIPLTLQLEGSTLRVTFPDVIAQRRHDTVPLKDFEQAGVPTSSAFEIDWTRGRTLSLDEPTCNVFRLEHADATITAIADAGTWSMPCTGPLRVIVDGPIVEIIGDSGVLAFPAPRHDDARLSGCGAEGTLHLLG